MLVMITLIATDLPLPVAPAIRRCGILVRSAILISPVTLRPSGTSIGLSLLGAFSTISRKPTVAICWFGTSIPINDFPGIGASIRISLAASASAKSSAKWVIRLTFTPTAGRNSYLVTEGPKLTFSTVASTPKDFRVCWSVLVFFLILFKSSC